METPDFFDLETPAPGEPAGTYARPAASGLWAAGERITWVAGLILAYIKRGEVRGTIWESHFANQIETFWVSLVLFVVAIPLCFVVIGVPILIGTVIWFLYRTIKGLVRAIENQPYY